MDVKPEVQSTSKLYGSSLRFYESASKPPTVFARRLSKPKTAISKKTREQYQRHVYTTIPGKREK